jgi:hypothetical protein
VPPSDAAPGGPPSWAVPPDIDRDRRRAGLLARIADPDLGQTPLKLPSVGTPLAMPPTSVIPGSGPIRTDAERRFERVVIPATVLAGISFVLFAIVGVAMLIGWSGAFPLTLLILFGLSSVGLTVLAVRSASAARKDTLSIPAIVWQSSQPWLGPLADSPERRLVGLACRAVGQIAGTPAWNSPSLDEHRLTLSLTAELDQIDAQAYALAVARHSGPGVAPTSPSPQDQWNSLLDHVAALEDYARAIASVGRAGAQGPSLGGGMAAGVPAGAPTAELAEARDQRLAAGAVQDEFATAHLQQLTADLQRRSGSG